MKREDFSEVMTNAAAFPSPLSSFAPQASSRIFRKILIANRGEIACRIIKTVRRMGIGTVAVYSEIDRDAHHVALADEAVCIGAGPSRESYLDPARVLDACRQSGAQAIHPGYGFLSERPDFARRVEAEGLTFIGPAHQSIAALGDKIAARALAQEAGLTVVPGSDEAVVSDDQAIEVAGRLGYPVMIKASAGGGGRGLRAVHNDVQLVEGLRSCRGEAWNSFGDDRLFLERMLAGARHVEVQILGDAHGNCIHLWERECSIQRRHQKLIEEAPSPSIDEGTRLRMCEQAVRLARFANYRSAGTVEFLVGEDSRFYFLEMNTRLQVEHTVTECLTGLDLVEEMIRIAAGAPLSLSQAEVRRKGWAMECRINADDPLRGFLPSAGRLVRYQPPAETMAASIPPPAGGGIRIDSGVREGDTVSTHYDSMICKLVAHADDRDACIARMRGALDAFVIRGVRSNVAFQSAMFAHPDFRAARFTTGFIAEHYADGFSPVLHPADESFLKALAVAAHLRMRQRAIQITGQVAGFEAQVERDYVVLHEGSRDGVKQTPATAHLDGNTFHVNLAGIDHAIVLHGPVRDLALHGERGGVPFIAQVERVGLTYHLSHNGSHLHARVLSPRVASLAVSLPARVADVGAREWLSSPMPGRLLEVAVVPGQRVLRGERLAVVEAMKMENVLLAAEDCVVMSVDAEKGDALAFNQVILRFERSTCRKG